MLDFDDRRWSELSHAYGAASDIPPLLRALALRPSQQGPDEEPWHRLWSSLCHQGDVYTASYAAVPHVVEIALVTPAAVDFSFFLLPASVEVARVRGRGPEVPGFLLRAYEESLERLFDCIAVHRAETWTQPMTVAAAAAVAVSKGHHDLAEALLNLDADLIAKINSGDWD